MTTEYIYTYVVIYMFIFSYDWFRCYITTANYWYWLFWSHYFLKGDRPLCLLAW